MERFGAAGDGGFVVQTYDLQLQQSIDAGAANRIIWGGGERIYKYGITNTASLLFEPPDHALTLGDAFVQDTMKLADQAALTVGVKFEDDPFAGWTPLPDARLSIGMGEHAALWAAASRAIRSPTPFDDEVVEKLGAVTELAAIRDSGRKRSWVRARRASATQLRGIAVGGVYFTMRTTN